MRKRFSPSTEHGPAMTLKLPPPILTPWPQSMTVSSGWNLRLARLKGSETRCTRSMMSMLSTRNGSICVVSPTRPMMVSPVPFEMSARRPLLSIQSTKWPIWSSVALSLTTAIMRSPPVWAAMRPIPPTSSFRQLPDGNTLSGHVIGVVSRAARPHAARLGRSRQRAPRHLCANPLYFSLAALLAQLDRASASGAEGRGFESHREHQFVLA